mgnify:FL=1
MCASGIARGDATLETMAHHRWREPLEGCEALDWGRAARGVIAWLLWRPRTREAVLGGFLARTGSNAFGACILHQPMLVGLHILTTDRGLQAFALLLLTAAMGIVLSFGLTPVMRRSPTVRRIV